MTKKTNWILIVGGAVLILFISTAGIKGCNEAIKRGDKAIEEKNAAWKTENAERSHPKCVELGHDYFQVQWGSRWLTCKRCGHSVE